MYSQPAFYLKWKPEDWIVWELIKYPELREREKEDAEGSLVRG